MRRNGFGYDEIIQRLNLSLRRSDFNGNDYELLQGLDANNHQPNIGASPEQLERLPSHVTSKEQEAKAKEEQKTCSICLGPFEEGHSVRTVACFHQFHKDCIDTWLTSNPLCPVCKVYALE
jgi:E3 ubiquitin-protein ligase ATL23